jgi:hypothetical protein
VLAWWTFVVGLLADLVVSFPGEFGMPHGTDGASEAASESILRGPTAGIFWGGAVILGHLVPLVLLGTVALAQTLGSGRPAPRRGGSGILGRGGRGTGHLQPVAGVLALVGLYLYEYAFVMAPQRVRNS